MGVTSLIVVIAFAHFIEIVGHYERMIMKAQPSGPPTTGIQSKRS
jgi:hypothetical protein